MMAAPHNQARGRHVGLTQGTHPSTLSTPNPRAPRVLFTSTSPTWHFTSLRPRHVLHQPLLQLGAGRHDTIRDQRARDTVQRRVAVPLPCGGGGRTYAGGGRLAQQSSQRRRLRVLLQSGDDLRPVLCAMCAQHVCQEKGPRTDVRTTTTQTAQHTHADKPVT